MRELERIDRILNKLRKVWKDKNQLRLGQLVIVTLPKNPTLSELFNLEDDKFEERLDKKVEEVGGK